MLEHFVSVNSSLLSSVEKNAMFLCTIGGWLSLGYVLYTLHIWSEHSSQKHPSNTRKKRCVLCLFVWAVSEFASVHGVRLWCLSSAGNRNIRFPLCAQCVLSVSSVFSCCQHKAVLRQINMPHCSFRPSVCAWALPAAHSLQILLDRFLFDCWASVNSLW